MYKILGLFFSLSLVSCTSDGSFENQLSEDIVVDNLNNLENSPSIYILTDLAPNFDENPELSLGDYVTLESEGSLEELN
jgi:hypothetical protein